MKLLDDNLVIEHFTNTILNNIITNNYFDKNKIKELENKNILIIHNRGNEATIYKIKLDTNFYIFKNYHNNFNKLEDRISFNNEKKVLSVVKMSIQNNICPNFIYCYKSSNDNDKYKYSLLEYADGNVYDLFESYKCTIDNKEIYEKLIKSFLFQTLVSLLVLHEKYNIGHNDLHLKNIFYKKIKSDTIFNYKINDCEYSIETEGYLFMLGDFGQSISLEDLKNKKKEYIENNKLEKYKKIEILLSPLISENYNSLMMLHNRLIKSYLEPIINDNNLKNLFEKKIIAEDNYYKIRKYLLDRNVSKKKLNKRIIQFSIDNNYINLSSLLPQFIFELYNIFKNLVPYIFAYANYLPLSYILQKFFSKNMSKNTKSENIFIIQTTTLELFTNYRLNMEKNKIMYNEKKYIQDFNTKIDNLKNKTLYNLFPKSNIFKCNNEIIGIDYKNNFGCATIFEFSNNKKKENEQIITIKKKLTNIINNNICPHFFKSYLINTQNIIDEVCNDTFENIISNDEYKIFLDKIINESIELKFSLIFQFVVINLCIIRYIIDEGTDFYINLYSLKYISINKKNNFKYIINNKEYYVPTFGFLLVIHTEDLFNMIKREKIIDETNCLRSLILLYLNIIKKEFCNLDIVKSLDLQNIIEKNSDINLKKEFNNYSKKMSLKIIERYSKIKKPKLSKDDYLEKYLYLMFINFIYLNNKKLLEKYIDKKKLANIINIADTIHKIIYEKNIDDVIEKYFNCFQTKLDTTNTFRL